MLATVNERKACAQTSVPSLPPKTFLSLQDGNTSMILATQNGHTMIATLLLQKGADKYAKNNVSNCRHRQCIVQMAMKCACMHGWMPSQSGGPVETHPSNLSLQAGNTSMRMAQSHCACPRPSPPPLPNLFTTGREHLDDHGRPKWLHRDRCPAAGEGRGQGESQFNVGAASVCGRLWVVWC